MNYRCENCDEVSDERDWGSSGYYNGNLPICPICGAYDSVDPDFEDDDEDEEGY